MPGFYSLFSWFHLKNSELHFKFLETWSKKVGFCERLIIFVNNFFQTLDLCKDEKANLLIYRLGNEGLEVFLVNDGKQRALAYAFR